MRLGASLPFVSADGGPIAGAALADGAALLERIGYASIWVFDAVGRRMILPDPFIALAVAATATSTVGLGTGVLQLPLRNTVETAYRALTLHHLAPGRFLFGVGTGSTVADSLAFGVDHETRAARFEEALPVLRELLRTGRHGEVDLTPWPDALGGPPLLVGSWRGRWVERAAVEADGWIASGFYGTPEGLTEGVRRYREAGGARAVVTNVQVGRDLGACVERLHRLAADGFDDAVVLDMTPTEDRLRAVFDSYTRGSRP